MISKAVEVLKNGGIVLYPTDTLYGLAVDSLNEEALYKLRKLKGSDKKTSVVMADIDMARKYVEIDGRAEKIINKFLPGKLTLVLPKIGGGDLGIRIPDNEIAISLSRELGRPITATSANKSGEKPKSSVGEILKDIDVDYYFDAGVLEDSASTVVRLTGKEIEVLREGDITKEQLEGINK